MSETKTKQEVQSQARCDLIDSIAAWARDNFDALPDFIRAMIADSTYFPQNPHQTFRFTIPECYVEIDCQPFLAAYRLLNEPESYPNSRPSRQQLV